MTASRLNNRYQILNTLGSGGFGQTFLAVDTHLPSQRQCVIKQIKSTLEGEISQKWLQDRFQREAAILEKLGEGHPQIPRLYAYFAESETFFLVQEYVEGVTLRQKVQQDGPLSEKEVWGIAIALLSVLNYIHSQRMVHRDIKPDNIILRAGDNRPVLLDFGAVKEAMGTAVHPDGNVAGSVAIGTPGYMPSEQAAGRPMYSSDLYSLGLTLVFLLTGISPYDLEINADTGEFLLQGTLPRLRSNLGAVIDRATRYHPRDRFTTAAAMGKALKTRPTSPKPPPPPQTSAPTVAARRTQEGPQDRSPMVAAETVKMGRETLRSSPIAPSTIAVQTPPPQRPPSSPPTVPRGEVPTSSPNLAGNWFYKGLAAIAIALLGGLVAGGTIFFATQQNSPPTPTVGTPPGSPPRPFSQQSRPVSASIPALTIGMTKSAAIAALGQPTSTQKGDSPNTRVLTYDNYVPNQAHLSYIVDEKSSQLRQIDITFEPSAHPELVRTTLMNFFDGPPPRLAMEGLRNILNRQTHSYSFNQQQFKGEIRRDGRDRLQIAIVDANLP